MQNVARTVRRGLPAALFLSAVVTFSAVVGCNDKKNDNNGGGGGGGGATTTSFAGWIANGTESGRLNVTINKAGLAHGRPGLLGPSVAVTASGTIEHTGGGTTSLTGTFDDESYDFQLTGGGYTFDGIYDSGPPGTVFGGYTGPNGGGRFAAETGSSSAQVYGGSYTAEGSSSAGTFLMAIRGTAIEGVATEDGDSTGLGFTGTITGTAISIQSPIFNGYKMHGTGTLNGTTHHVSGRYNIDYGTTPADSGSWSGDLLTTATP